MRSMCWGCWRKWKKWRGQGASEECGSKPQVGSGIKIEPRRVISSGKSGRDTLFGGRGGGCFHP